jgi:hypothetical protein
LSASRTQLGENFGVLPQRRQGAFDLFGEGVHTLPLIGFCRRGVGQLKSWRGVFGPPPLLARLVLMSARRSLALFAVGSARWLVTTTLSGTRAIGIFRGWDDCSCAANPVEFATGPLLFVEFVVDR